MLVEVGARGVHQHKTCLWLDLGQEAVTAGGCGRIPPFMSHWELLLVWMGRAKGILWVLQCLVQGLEQEALPQW